VDVHVHVAVSGEPGAVTKIKKLECDADFSRRALAQPDARGVAGPALLKVVRDLEDVRLARLDRYVVPLKRGDIVEQISPAVL
jgi:hypothetical protein